jgi:predicted RND superfamily exporter protein
MNKRVIFTVLGLGLVLILGVWAATQLNFNFSLSTFTAEDSQENINYQSYSKKFPVYGRGITIIVDFEKEISKREDFEKIDKLTNHVAELKGVKGATSITSVRLPERTVFGVKKRRLISLKNDESFQKRLNKLDSYRDVTPKFISKDKYATCIYVDLDSTDSGQTIQRIKDCVSAFGFPKVFYSGSEVLEKSSKEQFSSEMVMLPIIGGIGLLLLFFFFFHDVRSLAIVLVIIGFNISAILLTFWLLGVEVGMLTLTIPLLILVLSFCDIVHVLYTFKQKSSEITLNERLNATMFSLRKALWFTSLTTFCAFVLFTFSSVDQIVDFGLVTSIGIAIAYLSARYILPQFVAIFRVQPFSKEPPVQLLTKKLKMAIRSYRLSSGIGIFALLIAGLFATLNFSINISPHKNLGDELGGAITFLNENFEGTRTIEVVLSDEDGIGESTIVLVDSIEQYLLNSYHCNTVFSVNTVVKRLNRFNHFGFASYYSIPEKIDSTFLAQLEEHKDALGLMNAITDDHKLLRIVGRLTDQGSADARERNENLNRFLATLPVDKDAIFISGHSFVSDQSMYRVTRLILLSVALSVLMAMIVIGFVFRSVRLMLAMFIPNVLPLFSALVLMQLLGIDLNPFSAMALSIILGLSIDDTIYITSDAVDKNDGGPLPGMLEKSLDKNVFPVLTTSLLLAIGFGTLLFSNLESNKNIGILVSTVLLIALLSDLLILPALLKWTSNSNQRNTWK